MRGIRFATAFAVAWSLQAGMSFAAADWLDKLSGPGPFKELFTVYRFACFSNPADQKYFRPGDDLDQTGTTWLWPWDRTATVVPLSAPDLNLSLVQLAGRLKKPVNLLTPEEKRPVQSAVACKSDSRIRGYLGATVFLKQGPPGFVHFDNGTDENELVAGEPDVKHVAVWGADVGYFNRLNGAFDAGLAFGFKRFSGIAFGSLTKWYLAPSLEFAPWAAVSDSSHAHAVKLTIGTKIFLGQFQSSDFCDEARSTGANRFTCANPTWRSNGHYEMVPTIGLIVDTSVFR